MTERFRVAVVDDVEVLRRGRAHALRAQGLEVTEVLDFSEARAAVAQGRMDRKFIEAIVLDAHDNSPGAVPEISTLAGLDIVRLVRNRGGENALTFEAARRAHANRYLTIMLITQIFDDMPTLSHLFHEAGGDLLWPATWDVDHAEMAQALLDPEGFSHEQLARRQKSMEQIARNGLADAAARRLLSPALRTAVDEGIPTLARRYSEGDRSVRDSLNYRLRRWARTYQIQPPTLMNVYPWLRKNFLGAERSPSGGRLGSELPRSSTTDRRRRTDEDQLSG